MKFSLRKNHHREMIKSGTPDAVFGRSKSDAGYILLLTLLITSILLAVGFGIYDISIKEVVLSSFLRDSAKALAAADRGAECALYWDRSYPQNGFSSTIFADSNSYLPPADLANAVCHDGKTSVQLSSSATNWNVITGDASATTTFSLNFSDGTCADVMVVKFDNNATAIISDGYNTPGDTPNTCLSALPRRTQREIAVSTNF